VVVSDAFALVEPRVADALRPAVDLCAAHLAERAEIEISPEGLPAWFETFRVLQAAEVWANHGEWITRTNPRLGPGIKERFEWASGVGADQVEAASKRRAAIVRHLEQTIGPGDVLCLPTSPRSAPFRNTATDQIEFEYRNQAMCLLCIAGLGGLPQISLPLTELDEMPLGLSLIGRGGTDEVLLAFTTAICS
jgi:amidase